MSDHVPTLGISPLSQLDNRWCIVGTYICVRLPECKILAMAHQTEPLPSPPGLTDCTYCFFKTKIKEEREIEKNDSEKGGVLERGVFQGAKLPANSLMFTESPQEILPMKDFS